MHGAVLKSYQINPSDFIFQRAPTITEGTDFGHLLTGDATKKYGMSNNTSKTRMLGTGCYTQFWKAWGLLDSSYLLGLDLYTFLVWYECVFHSVSFLLWAINVPPWQTARRSLEMFVFSRDNRIEAWVGTFPSRSQFQLTTPKRPVTAMAESTHS